MMTVQSLTAVMAVSMPLVIAIVVVVAILAIIVISNIHIVPQGKAFVIEHLGSYRKTWQTGGIKFTIPFLQKV